MNTPEAAYETHEATTASSPTSSTAGSPPAAGAGWRAGGGAGWGARGGARGGGGGGVARRAGARQRAQPQEGGDGDAEPPGDQGEGLQPLLDADLDEEVRAAPGDREHDEQQPEPQGRRGRTRHVGGG